MTTLLATSANGNGFSMIFMLIIVFAMSYFFLIRPGKKQQQQRQSMLNQLKKGDQVVTIGGLHGQIYEINDEQNTILIDADGVILTFSRTAIREITPTTGVATTDDVPEVAAEPKTDDTVTKE